MNSKTSLVGRLVRLLALLILAASLQACGGGNDDGTGTNGDVPGNGSSVDGGSQNDDDNNDDGSSGSITATFSPGTNLKPDSHLEIVFSEAMDEASLQLGGSIAAAAETDWPSGDTLALDPADEWPTGKQTLRVEVSPAGSDESFVMEKELEIVADASGGYQKASVVIGQSDFSGSQINQGGASPDAETLNMPLGAVAYAEDEDVLFVPDSDNARILGYYGIPEVNDAPADFVLGQDDFTSSRGGLGQDKMITPQAVSVDGGRLVVTDNDGNRILVYDGVPTNGDAVPSVVVGQENMDERIGGCDQDSLIHPHDHLVTPDGKLLISDAGNNRVLVWNSIPEESGAAADLVLGQQDFGGCTYRGDENFKHPTSMWSDGQRLILADSEKHRVLIWNTFPSSNFEPADVILGQSDFFHTAPNDKDQDGETDADAKASARVMNYPHGVWVEAGRLYVADMDNHRILVWNEVPAENFAPADAVIGQPDMESNLEDRGRSSAAADSFDRPIGARVFEGKLFVTDWENSRILILSPE